jgi:hypothetical protein
MIEMTRRLGGFRLVGIRLYLSALRLYPEREIHRVGSFVGKCRNSHTPALVTAANDNAPSTLFRGSKSARQLAELVLGPVLRSNAPMPRQ